MAVLERAARHVILCVCPGELCIKNKMLSFLPTARFYFNPVVYRVACHWALMGLEASNCCYLDYGVKNLTNLIDCSFVLSSFFWNGCFITFISVTYFYDVGRFTYKLER